MPAPKGNKNAQTAWYTQTTPGDKAYLSARVSVELKERVKAALLPGETVNQFLIRVVESFLNQKTENI